MTPRQPTIYTSRYVVPISMPPQESGAILVSDGTILALDSYKKLASEHPQARVVDFGESVILPPMVNAHSHLELTAYPQWNAASGETTRKNDFVDWVLNLIRIRRTLSPDQIRASLVQGLRDSLRHGVGAIGDICTCLEVVDGYRSSALYGKVFAEVLGHDQSRVTDRLRKIKVLLNQKPGVQLTWGLSPHAPYTLSTSTLNQVFAFAVDESLDCAIHLAETADETRFLSDGRGPIVDTLYPEVQWDINADAISGRTPVSALCRPGRLNNQDLVVHGVHVNDPDISLLRETGCHVILCPRSNAALNAGKAPVSAYLKGGVPLALGTDSLASAPSLSIWDEVAFARKRYHNEVSPQTWLEIATAGGARALGLEETMGSLRNGSEASFQVVEIPEIPALDELEEALCAAGSRVQVRALFLKGRNVLQE